MNFPRIALCIFLVIAISNPIVLAQESAVRHDQAIDHQQRVSTPKDRSVSSVAQDPKVGGRDVKKIWPAAAALVAVGARAAAGYIVKQGARALSAMRSTGTAAKKVVTEKKISYRLGSKEKPGTRMGNIRYDKKPHTFKKEEVGRVLAGKRSHLQWTRWKNKIKERPTHKRIPFGRDQSGMQFRQQKKNKDLSRNMRGGGMRGSRGMSGMKGMGGMMGRN